MLECKRKDVKMKFWVTAHSFLNALVGWRFFTSTFIITNASFFINAIIFFMIGSVIYKEATSLIGIDYYTYLISGIVFTQLVFISLTAPFRSITWAHGANKFDYYMQLPIGPFPYIASCILFDYLMGLLQAAAYIVIGSLFHVYIPLQLRFEQALWLITLLILGNLANISIGLLLASLSFMIKYPYTLFTSIVTLHTFFANIYFPSIILGAWTKPISHALPLTHFINAIREILLNQAKFTVKEIIDEALWLTGFSLILTPLSIFIFRRTIHRAEREGLLIRLWR